MEVDLVRMGPAAMGDAVTKRSTPNRGGGMTGLSATPPIVLWAVTFLAALAVNEAGAVKAGEGAFAAFTPETEGRGIDAGPAGFFAVDVGAFMRAACVVSGTVGVDPGSTAGT